MAAARTSRSALVKQSLSSWEQLSLRGSTSTCIFCQFSRAPARSFAASARQNQNVPNSGPFRARLRAALKKTRTDWKPIPVALGIGFLGGLQFYRVQQREKRRQEEEDEEARFAEEQEHNGQARSRPRKRERIRPSGPWYALSKI